MKKENRKNLWIAGSLLTAFALWTAAVCIIDVQSMGPRGSSVGLATLNGLVHDLTGGHMSLYYITDWLGLVPFGVAMGFAVLGLVQWIKRRSIRRVDYSLLVLGGFYIVVMGLYAFFEVVVVNYRPVLIEGILEASYPSSTTMLVLCVMPTAMMQLRERIQQRVLQCGVLAVMSVFTAFLVIGRLLSGVHWFTDIVGGTLLSAGLVAGYHFVRGIEKDRSRWRS